MVFMNPPDLTFFFQLFSTLIGLIACYYCLRYYRLLDSKNYLLLSYLFFANAYLSLSLMYGFYFSNLFSYQFSQNPDFWNLEYAIAAIVAQAVWGIHFPVVAILLYRLLALKNRLSKGFFVFFTVEGTLQGFYYAATYVVWFLSMDFPRGNYLMDHWFLRVWFFHLLFNDPTGSYAIQLYLIIFYFLIGYTFFQLKHPYNDKSFVYSKRIWLIYGTLQSLRWLWVLIFKPLQLQENLLNVLDLFSPIVQEIIIFLRDVIFGYYAQFLEALALGGILIMLLLNPRSLLVTEAQLLKAKRLYHKFSHKNAPSKLTDLLSPKQRITKYFQNLPEDIATELNLKPSAKDI